MADQAAQDAAPKQRIITHMNNDHHDSVIRYLEHYHNLSAWTAYSGRLSDISLDKLTLSCNNKTYSTPFDPPMKSYREARERVVAMDHECLDKLGRSDITVQNFVPPTTGWLYPIETLVIAATFLSYSQRWWFGPGGPVAGVLGEGFARFSWVIQPWLLLGMIAIHGGEALWFERTRLRVHSVNPRTVVWWLWMGFCFLEGQFVYMRFKDLVEKKRAEKAKQKH